MYCSQVLGGVRPSTAASLLTTDVGGSCVAEGTLVTAKERTEEYYCKICPLVHAFHVPYSFTDLTLILFWFSEVNYITEIRGTSLVAFERFFKPVCLRLSHT